MKVGTLYLGWLINHSFHLDGFFGMVVEGRQRIGKSSYISQSMAEAKGDWEYHGDKADCVKADYEAIKKWIVYPPEQFLKVIMEVGVSDKQKCIHWDDAGFWLFVLDWYEPFVKTVAKYLQLAGRQFGSVFLSSPSQKMISGKVLEALPELYVCKIIKTDSDTKTYRPRMAKVFQRWSYPDGKRGGVRTKWRDRFNAILPDDFYNWYKPQSDHYLDIGLQILKREVDRVTKKLAKKEEEDFMEKVHKAAGSPERLKEVEEVIAQLEG